MAGAEKPPLCHCSLNTTHKRRSLLHILVNQLSKTVAYCIVLQIIHSSYPVLPHMVVAPCTLKEVGCEERKGERAGEWEWVVGGR